MIVDLELDNKVAIVIGAGKGIGKAVAIALAREGCRLVLCASRPEDLADVASEVRGLGRDALAVAADITGPEGMLELVHGAVSSFGTVHVLVNNVGGVGGASPFKGLSDDEWLEILDLNLLVALRLTRDVLPYMREQRWGRIINVASESTVGASTVGTASSTLRRADSKAAFVNFTKHTARVCGKDNITVNSVSPSSVATQHVEDMTAVELATGISQHKSEAAFRRGDSRLEVVVDRTGTPEEAASVVAFLASEKASFVTGADYRVDGGSTSGMGW